MKKDYTDITIILDRSGSMRSVKSDTIGGFNEFLKEQQEVPGKARLTLVQFDHEYQTVHDAVDIKEAQPLTDGTYIPRGQTALLDAIGRSLNETGARLALLAEEERPEKVVVVILTDGEENASREFKQQQIHDMITHQKDNYKWEFVFLGANQDAIKVAGNYGIAQDSAMSYAANSMGVRDSARSLSANLRSYRGGQSRDMSFSSSDRMKQQQAGAAKDSWTANKPPTK